MAGKRKGDCIYKKNSKCLLTDKNCKLTKEDYYLCDDYTEFEGKEYINYEWSTK